MDEFVADYVKIDEKVGRMFEITARIGEEIGNISAYTADLDIFWDGDANSAFITKIGEDLLEAGVILMRVRALVKAASSALDLYQKNEKEIKRMIGDYGI